MASAWRCATMSSNIKSLRTACTPIFSKPDFSHVIWAGVFGSFAREKQTDSSDVDVVVLRKTHSKCAHSPPDTLHLEDELPKAWGRKTDIVYITGDELRGYVSIEALLCSRTLFGADQDDVVVQLRNQAAAIISFGFATFTSVLRMIRKTQSMLSSISLEEFKRMTTLQRAVRDDVLSILENLDIQPAWHPMRDAFWHVILEPAMDVRRKIYNMDVGEHPPPDDMGRLNEAIFRAVATMNTTDSLEGLARRITKFVFPVLEETCEQSELVKGLELIGSTQIASGELHRYGIRDAERTVRDPGLRCI